MNWNYISGFFDADGSICLSKVSSKNETLCLTFHNNELSILEEIGKFIESELGFKGRIQSKKPSKKNHNIAYELRYYYRQAYQVSLNINSFHPKKKKRIGIYKSIQNATNRGGHYTEETKMIRQKLVEEFKQVKMRGKRIPPPPLGKH